MTIVLKIIPRYCCCFILTLTSGVCLAVDSHSYSLQDLEKIAVEKAPELEQLRSNQVAIEESAVAAGQLSDPKLQAGLINLPTDTFNTTQENMTQIKFGIVQNFPRGSSLAIKSEQQQLLAVGEGQKHQAIEAKILRIVRMNWLELYYLLSARKILNDAKKVFAHLVKVTTSTLSVGKGNQHDVLRAQLDLTQVESQLIQIEEYIQKVRARLARLVGAETSNSVYPNDLPKWPAPSDKTTLHARINQHPIIQKDDSLIAASRKEVELSKELNKPAWSLGLQYSFRQGHATMSSKRRADFIGVQLTTELPFFTSDRQDRKVAASMARHSASKSQKAINLLDLSLKLSEYSAIWVQLKKQESLYKNRLVPEAKQYAKATLTAYENRQIDFPTVARAYDKELMVSLQSLRIMINRYQARVSLLYLETGKS